jgi:membrane-associated phospholipid phosphatase
MSRSERLLGWPGWGVLGYASVLGVAQTLWFVLIYGGADYLTGLHSYRVRLHLDAELSIPFVPAASLGYVALYPLFCLAPFVLRTRRELNALARTLAVVTLTAGGFFLLIPGLPAFPEPSDLGGWEGLVRFTKRVALTYNFMPSLHVALTAVCALTYATHAGTVGKVVLGLWSAGVSVSTLLLHQHYLVDVVTGYGLAWAAVRWVYRPQVGDRKRPDSSFRASGGAGAQR